jgi:ankyrin repeat protein
MNPLIEEFLRQLEDLPAFDSRGPVKDVNAKGLLSETPLHVAAIQGRLDVVRALVSAGAELNAQAEHNYTPLHEAIEQEHRDVARFLIEAGAKLDVANADGVTPQQMLDWHGWLDLGQ